MLSSVRRILILALLRHDAVGIVICYHARNEILCFSNLSFENGFFKECYFLCIRAYFISGFRIRIRRIRMFLPCPDLDPDPHKFADPDPGKKVRK